MTSKCAIQHDDTELYYTGMTHIGPSFGGTREQAMIFDNSSDAALEMVKHWAFSAAAIVPAKWLLKKKK